MKKLDKLIVKSFLGPFIVTFFIAVFVLMMQIVWKYIDDLVGKGLDLLTIGKFVWYASASLLALAMPIAILISSIMTFGNLGESFELVAIKSAGISLLRFMRPIAIITAFLCVVTFLFANYIIPYSQLKFVTLYNDIFYKKPAFDLKPGSFYSNIPGYGIRVGHKDADGKSLSDVLIYEQNNPLQDNTITAKKGLMTLSSDKNFMEFHLTDGYRYQEQGAYGDTSTDYTRLHFKDYKKIFDMSVLKKQTTPDSVFKNNQKMMSARQLDKKIATFRIENDSSNKVLNSRYDFLLHFTKIPDSIWKATPAAKAKPMIPDSALQVTTLRTSSIALELKGTMESVNADRESREKNLRFYELEWHRKFAFSLTCMVLFFIGAPMGSIIRKGGLGMPLLVAILFFLVFHLLNTFGEKLVREGTLSPFMGMWLATIVLTPVGAFLTYKALHDSQLFNKEAYIRAFRNLKSLVTFKKPA